MKLKRLLSYISFVCLIGYSAIAETRPRIAITQFVDHPALNLVHKGILDALNTGSEYLAGPPKILYQNAHGKMVDAAQIARIFVSQKVDLMIAISTPAAQTTLAANSKAHIPLIFASVTDPIAAKLCTDLVHHSAFVTGIIDTAPIQQTLETIRKLFPEARSIGILYNPSEVNSSQTVAQYRAQADTFKIIEGVATSTNEVLTATRRLLEERPDILLLPSDNTTFAALGSIASLATHYKIPTVCNVPESVDQGILLGIGYSQYQIGIETGKLALEILNGKKVETIPVQTPMRINYHLNSTVANTLNIYIGDTLRSTFCSIVH